MDLPELSKIRRFAMTVALVVIAFVLAGVKLKVPLEVSPLGFPLVIDRPDLLTVSLVVAAIYSTLRYIYYGMLVRPSPMRARRALLTRTERTFVSGSDVMENFHRQVQADVGRLFPRVGASHVTFDIMQDAAGTHVMNMRVPRAVRLFCWIENIDFVLPILLNCAAVGLWTWSRW